MLRRTFHAMGTEVELLLDAVPGDEVERALEGAESEFGRLEAVMSRFASESELSTLNRLGRLEHASADLLDIVRLALAARETTGGLFDPTVHDALVAAGYDRSFEDVPASGSSTAHDPLSGGACGGRVRIDGSSIELDPGTRLDLGGIGKGYAADRAAEILNAAGPCLVNAGGDIAVHGGAWPIAVADGLTLELTRGGMATSGRDRRRWSRDGDERHHLIDPGTGRPAAGTPLRVTVVAESATAAEVEAKVAFLGGDIDVPRVIVADDGSTVLAGGLA